MAEPVDPASGFLVRGGVERGDQRGRTLGFPTANIAIEQSAYLDGVWAGYVGVDGNDHVAAISIGNRPTFYGRTGFRLLEAHLLDYDADIYDEVVTVWLATKLREQCRFESADELVEQLNVDVAATREWAAGLDVGARRPIEDGRLYLAPLGRALVGRASP